MKLKTLKREDMTLRQKIGTVLTGRVVGDREDFEFMLELIREGALGAIQIPPNAEAVENYVKPVLEAAEYPILIGADMERGCQLGDLIIPGNMALGATGSVEDVYTFAKATAKGAKAAGFNMIWSPVVDLADFDRPNIITRCFGSEKEHVAECAIAYMKAFAECGVVGTAKHYPSAQDTLMDTHMAEGTSSAAKERLIEHNLYAYRRLIDELGEDMCGIMSDHTRCINIDPEHPATLSKKVMSIIRELGFNGMIITDSMAMVGIIQKYGDEAMHGMALAAGNDLILGNYRTPLRKIYGYMMKNFEDGIFSEERLNEAVDRVLAAQARTLRRPEEGITDAEREAVKRVSKDCICYIKDDGVSPTLDRNKKHLFVIDCENLYAGLNAEAVGEISFTKWWDPHHIANIIKERFPNSTTVFACEFPSRYQVESVCAGAASHDDVIYVTYCDSECYQGTDGLTERMRILIESTAIKTAAIIHFGNPYAIEKVVHLPRRIFGFPSTVCIDTAFDVLTGEYEPKGVLPVKLKLK